VSKGPSLPRPQAIRLSRGRAILTVKPVKHRSADNACGLSVPFEFEHALHRNSLPAEKSLAKRIHERSLDCRPKNADAGALCGTVESAPNLPPLSRMMSSGPTPRVWLPGAGERLVPCIMQTTLAS
jgi:hypothetical protein